MANKNVLSFPVVDSENEYRVVGLVDMIDMAAFVVDLFEENVENTKDSKVFGQIAERKLKALPVYDLMSTSRLIWL